MIAFFRRHATLTWSIALVVLWTLELYVVQERSLIAPFKDPKAMLLRQIFRFGIDVSLVTFLVFTLPRRAMYALFATAFLVFAFGGVYLDYYGRLPRLTVVTGQAGEGTAILPLVIGMMPVGRTTLLLLGLVAKCGLVYALGLEASRQAEGADGEGTPRPKWRARARYVAAAVYVLLIVIADRTFDPMYYMKRWGTSDRYGMTYGFTIPMVVEAYFARSQSLLARAQESASQSTDALTPVEAPIDVHDRIVFLQIESLDYGVIDYHFEGTEVTPRFNELRRQSLYYKVRAAHFTGSADSDFVALMGVWPSRDIVTYKIAGYPFDSALPHRLGRWGYRTVAIHGVSGNFFDRRDGFTRMGFDELLFKEELKELGVRVRHDRYDWIQDAELFAFAKERMRQAHGRTFHFVITVTSHSPFEELPPQEAAKCPRFDDKAARYFCSMRYVDRAVGDYLDALPEGTTVVVWGDHNSSVEHDGYDSGRQGKHDWVPAMVYNHPEGLASKQRSGARATDGSLTFVDVMKYVHHQVARKHGGSAER